MLELSTEQALLVLMHDAAHDRLFRNTLLNNTISDLCLAYPLWVSTSVYRRRHLAHQQYLPADKDPDFVDMQNDEDWDWPKLPSEC